MPGAILHVGATVCCAHGGQAQPATPNLKVKVMGQPIATQPTPYIIAGCTNPAPPTHVGPCATAQWVSAATRVKSMGQPVLLQDSRSLCLPAGTPLTVVVAQSRVKGI